MEAAAISQPQTTVNVSPTTNQASFKEFSTQGIPVTPALASVLPHNVAAHIAHGQRLIGVSIRHFFFARQGTKMVPTSLAHWEQLNHLLPGQYNVITSSLIRSTKISRTASRAMDTNGLRLYPTAGQPLGVTGPSGGDGISGMYDNNQLSLEVWITQNSTSSINYTFDGQALWSSYDTVTGYSDYTSLAWWPNEGLQGGTLTHSAVGVNVNNSSQTMAFPSSVYNNGDNQDTVKVPQTEYQSSVEYALQQVDWGCTVADSGLSPNDYNAGDLNAYYTQTWQAVNYSFTVGTSGAGLTVSPTSAENKWELGPLNWSPNTSQTT